MSPDTTFAAQFWLWPDPAMKRDAYGRILFVNAAFIQLYGGSVEAWTGNVLQGWPAPQPVTPGVPPAPYRFETRIPSADPAMGEQVYDWIEQSEQDGSAFALARNITAYMQAPAPQTAPVMAQSQVEAQPEIQAESQAQATYSEQAPVIPETAQAPVEATAEFAPELTHAIETPQAQFHTQEEAAPHAHIDNTSVPSSAMAPVQPEMAPQIESEPAAPKTEERDFERRALPLESNSSILGNNWRDAVIAKAVGAEAPEETENSQAEATVPQSEGGADQRRILLAEDNAINALLTRTLLEAEGHTVETVEDGLLAVEAMKSNNYDLIFMDMRMPNMDGLEATRKIRQLPNVPKALPIIALTANAFDDDRNACFDSGMNDFMTKPVSAEELTQMVKNWTGENAQKQAA